MTRNEIVGDCAVSLVMLWTIIAFKPRTPRGKILHKFPGVFAACGQTSTLLVTFRHSPQNAAPLEAITRAIKSKTSPIE
jgi:hypothetical protein